MNPLVVSLLKFAAVTIICGALGAYVFPIWPGLLVFSALAIVLQFLIEWVLQRYEAVKRAHYEYEQRLDEQAILAANSVQVDCAGCKTPHSIPIIATQRNLFKCRKCEGENVIIVTAETALTTNIADTNA